MLPYYHQIIIFWYYYLAIFIVNFTNSQDTYQSLSVLSGQGVQFVPANIPAQFISSIFVDSWRLCATQCHMNPLCRVFDYGSLQPSQCLLFEGDIDTSGTIMPSTMPDSVVGAIQITPSLFIQYGQSCSSVCTETRYLICNDKFICECMPHTYWDASVGVCLAQMTMSGAPCNPIMDMCREDLGLQCTPLNLCTALVTPSPPPSGIIGTTIADRNTVIEGSLSVGLEYPIGITVYDAGNGESLIVCDSLNNEVISLWNIDSRNKNISVLASNWTGGDSLTVPSYIFLDTNNQNDLYVTDSANQRVLLFSSMQITNPPPQVVAGITGVSGSTPDRFVVPYGVAVDSEKNVYVADNYNHRVMLWAANATSGIMIAGTGTAGSGSMELQYPIGLFLDEYNSLLYVADRDNHRIQLFNLNGTPPYVGITVAGGTGAGSGRNQLYQPSDVWVSSKTGAIYIADASNQRIQCWSSGATSGITVAGDSSGMAGSDATKLSSPSGLTVNKNETRLYVSDTGNGRIQRFDLI